MSTSMLVKKMQEEAASRGIDAEISAVPMAQFEEAIQEFDTCLLGPQISFKYNDFKAIAESYGKSIETINPRAYGLLKGSEVLDQALSLIEKQKAETEPTG